MTELPCGPSTVFFEMDSEFPLVTLAQMLSRTPDWFVGVTGLSLFDEQSGWSPGLLVDLFPFDGGSQGQSTIVPTGVALPGSGFTDPATTDPISLITAASDQQIGPGRIGQYRFTLVRSVPLPAALPLLAAAMLGLGLLGWRRKLT